MFKCKQPVVLMPHVMAWPRLSVAELCVVARVVRVVRDELFCMSSSERPVGLRPYPCCPSTVAPTTSNLQSTENIRSKLSDNVTHRALLLQQHHRSRHYLAVLPPICTAFCVFGASRIVFLWSFFLLYSILHFVKSNLQINSRCSYGPLISRNISNTRTTQADHFLSAQGTRHLQKPESQRCTTTTVDQSKQNGQAATEITTNFKDTLQHISRIRKIEFSAWGD